jgi:hypothetical protein
MMILMAVGCVTDSNSQLVDLVLPADGVYRIEVRSAYGGLTSGAYTLVIERGREGMATATPSPKP